MVESLVDMLSMRLQCAAVISRGDWGSWQCWCGIENLRCADSFTDYEWPCYL